jgi:tetratricopeptide (TPR) repeat protein
MKTTLTACLLVCVSPGVFGCDVIGVLDGLALAGSRVSEVDVRKSWLERKDDRGRMVTKPVTNGMPLCRGDRLITASDVTANLRIGSAGSEQKQITVSSHSTLLIKDDKKIEILGGGFFAQIKGAFDTIFNLGVIAAGGTQFSVELRENGARVVQLEDETVFKPKYAPTSAAVKVTQREEVGLEPGVTQAKPIALTFDRCKAATDPNSKFVAETRAKRPSLPLSHHFSPQEIGKAFADARVGMLCRSTPEDPAAAARVAAETAADRERVGLIYVDWVDPEQALRLLTSSPVGSTPAEQARHFTAIGNAMRIEGEPEQAIGQFQHALSAVPAYARALNGMGDALRDQGIKAYGNTVQEKNKAAELFEAARKSYEQAASDGTGTPEVELAMVNAGNLHLLMSGVFPDRGDQIVDTAEGLFNEALRLTNGKSLHARLGLARVEMQRAQLIPQKEVDPTGLSAIQLFAANLIYGMQAENERKPVRERAEAILAALVRDEPDFAPGLQTLGELYLALSNRNQARIVLRRAINTDPRHTISYSFLAQAYSGDVGEIYRDAYKNVEFPAMRTIARARQQLATVTAPSVKVPSNLLIPDVSTLRFGFASHLQTRTVTFTNAGDAPVTPTSAIITGSDAGAFTVQNDGCSNRAVAPHGECRIVVVLQAQTPDKYKAMLEVSAGGPISTTVELRASLPSPAPQSDAAGAPIIL